MPVLLLANHLPKTDVVAVEVLDAEFAAAVGLITGAVVNGGTPLLELGAEGIDISDPEVHVAEFVGDGPMRDDMFGIFSLLEHEVAPVTMKDAESVLAIKPIVVKTQFVTIVLRGGDDVPDEENSGVGGKFGSGHEDSALGQIVVSLRQNWSEKLEVGFPRHPLPGIPPKGAPYSRLSALIPETLHRQ